MKPTKDYYAQGLLLSAILLSAGCSTTGDYTEHLGATEQRLVTQSIDRLAEMLPSEDFEPIRGKSLFVKTHFIKNDERFLYATERLKMALVEKFAVRLAENPEQADNSLHVFFNALASDKDTFGLQTPEVVVPGSGSIVIDIIALDMFHGVSELHYYLMDKNQQVVKHSDQLRATVRTDKLNLPFISIPIQTLD